MLIKDKAVCIKAIDYSDTSQIVTLLVRNSGKISAIAKGSKRARSSFDGPIDIFSFGEMVFSQKPDVQLATLTEFHQTSELSGLSKNLFPLHCAMFATELTNALTDEHDPHPELFDALIQFLKDIQHSSNRQESLMMLIIFQLRLLGEVGLKPVLNRCINCKHGLESNSKVYFSCTSNGIVCRDCETAYPDRINISNAAASCLGNIKTITQITESVLSEIEKILCSYFTELLGRIPKMAKYILPS